MALRVSERTAATFAFPAPTASGTALVLTLQTSRQIRTVNFPPAASVPEVASRQVLVGSELRPVEVWLNEMACTSKGG